jgi:hypothetical protein
MKDKRQKRIEQLIDAVRERNDLIEQISTPIEEKLESLLPCPFCGGLAIIEETEMIGHVRKSVGCKTEGCQGYQSTSTFATRREASRAWNQRAWRDMLEWQQLAGGKAN